MKLAKITIIILSGLIFSCSNKSEKNGEWEKITRERKTIDNITYYFSSKIDISKRNSAIQSCQNSITENLKLINETNFTNEMDIEFVESRKEMLKYGGFGAQGLAFPKRNTMFALLNEENKSIIKHEMMHMITMYKWGNPANTSRWMNEGFATYSAGFCMEYTLEEIYKYFLQSNKLINFKELAINFYKYNDMITYTQSAFICKYLIDNFGLNKFKKLWKGGFSEMQSVYGFSHEVLQKKIKVYINEKIPNDIKFDWEEFNKGC